MYAALGESDWKEYLHSLPMLKRCAIVSAIEELESDPVIKGHFKFSGLFALKYYAAPEEE